MKIKIPVEILIPDGEDCTYTDNYTIESAFQCRYFEMRFGTIPSCLIFIENHNYAKLEERISGSVMTGYKKCDQCLKVSGEKASKERYY